MRARTQLCCCASQSSTCWVLCLFETLTGNASTTPPVVAMNVSAVISAFEDAFDSCESVPDCPDPCLPPCWGVPAGQPCDPN